jgi:hypothetical protein
MAQNTRIGLAKPRKKSDIDRVFHALSDPSCRAFSGGEMDRRSPLHAGTPVGSAADLLAEPCEMN